MYAYASSTATRQQNESMTPRKSPTVLNYQDFSGYESYTSCVFYSEIQQGWQGQISFFFKSAPRRRKKFGGRSKEIVEQKIKDFIEKVPKEKQSDSGSADLADMFAQSNQQKSKTKRREKKRMGRGPAVTPEVVRWVKDLTEHGYKPKAISELFGGHPSADTVRNINNGGYDNLLETDHGKQERQEVASEVAEEVPAEQEIIEAISTTGTSAEEQEPETPRIFPETETAEEIEGMIKEEKLMAQAIRYAIEDLSKDIRRNTNIDVIKSDADAIKTLAEAYDTIRRRTI